VITQWALICFEYSAINVILAYWFDDFNPAITISIALVLLTAINMYSVRWFGEVEFWISVTKLFLIFMLTMYTFVTMVGGNPLHDRYGFRYWKTPGPFKGQSGVAVVRGIFDAISWGTFA
jgi:amino acid transporter